MVQAELELSRYVNNQKYDVIIIGAGASGLFCAKEASRRGRNVLMLDHMDRPGRKILVSGGGRCNFTNLNMSASNFVSANPDFTKSALSRFTPRDFLSLLDEGGIRYFEKTVGQMFCTDGAKLIVNLLRDECVSSGTRFLPGCEVTSVEKENIFRIETTKGCFCSDSLVVATGGLSFPNLGATSFGYDMARQFGLSVAEISPALVPLVLSGDDLKMVRELSGMSLEAGISCNGYILTDTLLFTHRGISGPAGLQASLYWTPGSCIIIDLLPGKDIKESLENQAYGKTSLKTLLTGYLPARLAGAWCERFGFNGRINQYSHSQLQSADASLHNWRMIPAGTEGFRKAEVTRGGVCTEELSSKTMESKKVKGLYFIGETVDVTGQLGGYNLQWAWSSGWAAGQVV